MSQTETFATASDMVMDGNNVQYVTRVPYFQCRSMSPSFSGSAELKRNQDVFPPVVNICVYTESAVSRESRLLAEVLFCRHKI